MEHALGCVVRLIRLLLGTDAVADAKTAFGPSLGVLGVQIESSMRGFKYWPSPDKAQTPFKYVSEHLMGMACFPPFLKVVKWLWVIECALATGRLVPGAASKLAGKLAWGSSQLFRRIGRAMLRPLFDQKSRRDGRVGQDLRRALLWWQQVWHI